MDSRDRWNDFDEAYAKQKRMLVVSIVVVLHFAVLTFWLRQPPNMLVPEREMEVTMAASVTVQADKPSLQASPPVMPIQQRVEMPTPRPLEPALQQSNTPVAIPGEPAPVEQAAAVVEPDYKAAYLNNRLTYPLAARRMGIQGRVVLNVEVLVDGMPGQINLQQSSGHEVLDKAALESVKSWRFVPARRAGQPYTKWFLIPIQFSLKGNES